MTPPRNDDYDRDDRPSWSEIDKRKDKSPHSSEKTERQSPKQEAWMKTAALKQANALFKDKIPAKARGLIERMGTNPGSEDYIQAVEAFLAEYGLPDEWKYLKLFLDYPKSDVFEQVVELMLPLYPDQSMADRRVFKSKLSILSNTARSAKIQRIAKKAKDKA